MNPRTHLTLLAAGCALILLAATAPASAQCPSSGCICSPGTCDQVILGGSGNDSLNGTGATRDCMYGCEGNDTINSFGLDDFIDGYTGDDPDLTGGAGSDCICGGDGSDSIHGGDGTDTLDGLAGVDFITGDGSADSLWGFTEGDVLAGNTGNDTLNGEDGDDDLNGGSQNVGGSDTCNCGPGTDRYTQCEVINSCETAY